MVRQSDVLSFYLRRYLLPLPRFVASADDAIEL